MIDSSFTSVYFSAVFLMFLPTTPLPYSGRLCTFDKLRAGFGGAGDYVFFNGVIRIR
jgi:hypothetical protein